MTNGGDKLICCSFCDKNEHDVTKLIAGPRSFICNECITLCGSILQQESPRVDDPVGRNMQLSHLRAGILEVLDEHIMLRMQVGMQQEAIDDLRNLLKPLARMLLTTDPRWHRTTVFDPDAYNKAILDARSAFADEEWKA